MKITATSHEITSAITTTQKMPPAYSPLEDLAKPTGMKPAAVTSVPVSIGNAVEVQAKVAAFARSKPCSIFTTIISMAMMASSTSSPSARMSEPSDTRCRSMPKSSMATNTPASVNGTESATMMPVRKPSERKLTAITMPTATANLNRNSPIASSTTCGWLAMRVNSMPTGRSARIAFSATASALPRSITLAPLAMATPRATACAPL